MGKTGMSTDGDADLEARIAYRQTGIVIREFARRLAWWEGHEGHATVGIPWLRNHFRLLLDRYPLPDGDMYKPFTPQPVLVEVTDEMVDIVQDRLYDDLREGDRPVIRAALVAALEAQR